MFKREKPVRAPKFSQGNVVRIRSREEISQILDPCGQFEGCLMMDQMWQFCGKMFKVVKIVNNLFDEKEYKMYKTRSTLYMLEGLICDGEVDSSEYRCDRSCYLFWHEEWLEKL